jgi:uncharacterized membrane protein YgaE (UPF0421/DUF939 family)
MGTGRRKACFCYAPRAGGTWAQLVPEFRTLGGCLVSEGLNGYSTGIVALFLAGGIFVGGAVGYLSHALFSPPPAVVVPAPEIIEQQISDEDLARLCATLTADEKSRAQEAQSKVSSLQSQIEAKEAELAKMKAEKVSDDSRRAAAQQKWKAMEAEIADLRGRLQVAETERDQVRTELRQTLQELDRQVAETAKYKEKAIEYKEKSTTNLWSSFLNEAKVEICDRGTRNRHERCHEAVEGALTESIRNKFTHCVDSNQATPALRQLDRREALPQWAERLPDNNKFTRNDWVIVFCDPTLPEAGGVDDL